MTGSEWKYFPHETGDSAELISTNGTPPPGKTIRWAAWLHSGVPLWEGVDAGGRVSTLRSFPSEKLVNSSEAKNRPEDKKYRKRKFQEGSRMWWGGSEAADDHESLIQRILSHEAAPLRGRGPGRSPGLFPKILTHNSDLSQSWLWSLEDSGSGKNPVLKRYVPEKQGLTMTFASEWIIIGWQEKKRIYRKEIVLSHCKGRFQAENFSIKLGHWQHVN